MGLKLMSKQSIISISCLFLAFASGIGLGIFVGGTPSPSDDPKSHATISTAADASVPEAETHNRLLDARILDLEKELEDQKKDQDALILADRLALFKKNHKYLGVQALDENLKVTPAMVDILKLSPQEQQAIEQHLAQIQEETQKFEDSKMVLVKQSGNSVTYEIPTYSEGKELKTRLADLLAADIGGERAELFMTNSGTAIASQFSNFGEQKSQIEITQTDRLGTCQIKESYFNSDGVATSTLTRSGVSDLPQRWQKLIQLEPTQ
jgi:hypothetical protein